jgi:hypothetical protein
MHQPFIHMMQRSGDRNSCGYAGGPQPFSNNAKPVQGRIPYFGTMWLPRQLAGCAGKVVCQDEEVAEKMHSYAEGLLHQLS